MLKNLSIHNYKSLRHVELNDLPNFAVFVGANASGKSNFADALDFLGEVFRSGLAAAVRAKGGYENICFRKARRSKGGIEFSLRAEVSVPEWMLGVEADDGPGGVIRMECLYKFCFGARSYARTGEYAVIEERLTTAMGSQDDQRRFVIERVGDRVSISGSPDTVDLLLQQANPDLSKQVLVWQRDLESALRRGEIPQDDLMCRGLRIAGPALGALDELLNSCHVYRISPYVTRETGVPERWPQLGRHGENLPAAVEYLRTRDHPAYEELIAYLQYAVPTIEAVETDYVETKQLGLFFKEKGFGRRWFAQDVSDGTLQTLALFLPLVDKRVKIAVIEEPENNVHPWVVRLFVEACQMYAKGKQIFLTTHSPAVLNASTPESLFLVRRERGETSIGRCTDVYPETRRVVEELLMLLGEHWESGAIGAVPEREGLFVE